MSGTSWKNEGNCVFGCGWEKEGQIDWISYRGDCEEIKEIKEEIKSYRVGKDYSYSSDKEEEFWGKCENYTIHGSELKKKLWELCGKDDEIDVPKMPEFLEVLNYPKPSRLIKPIKPIKPTKPIKPIGRKKENKEWWKDYEREAKQYKKEMDEFLREIEDYNREVQEYNKEIENYAKKFAEEFGKNQKNNKKQERENSEYVRKCCPVCRDQDEYKVQLDDNFCRNCSRRLVERSILSEKEDKKWKWKEFWIGCVLTLTLSIAIFVLFKLFKKKR